VSKFKIFESVSVSEKVTATVGTFLFGGPGFRQLNVTVQLNESSLRVKSETVVSGPSRSVQFPLRLNFQSIARLTELTYPTSM
jgi:hypothetical protein